MGRFAEVYGDCDKMVLKWGSSRHYSQFGYIPLSRIKRIELLKYEIETSKTIAKLHSYIMSIKTRDFIKSTKIERTEFMNIIKSFYVSSSSYNSNKDKKISCSFSGDYDLKDKIDEEIIAH